MLRIFFLTVFFLTSIPQGKKELQAVDSAELDEETDGVKVSDSEDETFGAAAEDDSPSDMDSDEEQKR